MLTKLYKKENKQINYWEIWDNNNVITTHWGVVGDVGESKEIKVRFWQKLDDIFKKEIENAKKDGYEEIPAKDHIQVIVQFKIQTVQKEQLDKRVEIENLINHSFGWIGLGHCDGGDIGSGKMNIFSYVVDANIATKFILELFKEKEIKEDFIIAVRKGEDVKVVYPQNYKGKFNY